MMAFLLFFILFSTSPNIFPTSDTPCKNSKYILEQSQKQYDPEQKWNTAELSMHIQEPRILNPTRYSVLKMNNETGYFSLVRDSEAGMIKRVIDEAGNPSVLLNGSSKIEESIIEDYRLGKERNFGYRDFYKLMYGLPMSITKEIWSDIADASAAVVDGEEVYIIDVILKEPMIGKHWQLLISRADFSLNGVRIFHDDSSGSEGELIIFDGMHDFGELSIPRFRHWYELNSNVYSGSDVIVKVVE